MSGGVSPAAGALEIGAVPRRSLPPEDTTSARPRLRNWTGGARGVGRKDCWVGADSRGAQSGGRSAAARGRRSGAAWPPAFSPRADAQCPHCAPTPPHPRWDRAPFTSRTPAFLGVGELRSARVGCGRPGRAGGAAVRVCTVSCWSSGRAPSQPCGSRAPTAHAAAAPAIYRCSLRRPRRDRAGLGAGWGHGES